MPSTSKSSKQIIVFALLALASVFGVSPTTYASTDIDATRPQLTCQFENSTVRVYTLSALTSENPSTSAKIQIETQDRQGKVKLVEEVTTLYWTEWSGSGHLISTISNDPLVSFNFGARSALDSDAGLLKIGKSKQVPLISCSGEL